MIKVSNIERFATHDGPGIRTTIFLKGCPLHCPWCANPETWTINPVLMHDEKKCVRCHCCQKECGIDAISFQPQFVLDTSKCTACGKCVDVCIPDALSISGKDMNLDEILKEVQKDDAYYQNSNGGVTLSGGEPFFQFQEMFQLLKELKGKGYHIAIETTGMYSLEHLKEAEPYIDVFLHDIKQLDENILQEVTGAKLEVILKNLDYLSKKCPEKVVVRVPVIPGFNNDEKYLQSVIEYAKKKGFKEVNLLPYHSLGKNKWHNLKKKYQFEEEKMMDKDSLYSYIDYGKQIGMYVKIGG